jgi:hypothetical protein
MAEHAPTCQNHTFGKKPVLWQLSQDASDSLRNFAVWRTGQRFGKPFQGVRKDWNAQGLWKWQRAPRLYPDLGGIAGGPGPADCTMKRSRSAMKTIRSGRECSPLVRILRILRTLLVITDLRQTTEKT